MAIAISAVGITSPPMAALTSDTPFALLPNGDAMRLFTDPQSLIAGRDLRPALQTMRRASQDGFWLAGGISYESGHQLEPRLQSLGHGQPFHWFGCFKQSQRIDDKELRTLLNSWRGPVGGPEITPMITQADWLQMMQQAHAHIAAGDIYQVNLTFPLRLDFTGHPLALFAQLFDRNAAPQGGIVHDGKGRWWLSFSPELFFHLQNGRIEARPMKGTMARGDTPKTDMEAAQFLANDPKNQAENLMITDLMRNDLSRIARIDSVRTPHLFAIETYPTVHQMTSTVTAELRPELDALDAIAALLPCGSITGAPRIRAMEIIADQEQHPRGIYCGTLGWIAPGARSARMNVAIRTIAIEQGTARLGVGAGITIESDAQAEWNECLLKAKFLRIDDTAGQLIETMRLEASGQIPRLPLHLSRMQASATALGFAFDKAAIQQKLQQAMASGSPARLRLLLSRNGKITLERTPLPPTPAQPVPVAICPLPVEPNDWRLRHKTTNRAFHDDSRMASGAFECIYERPDGLLTEGSFTNLFVARDGLLLTPPAALGLLPGTLRAELLADGRAIEAPLRRADLQQGFFIGNSLRGLLHARLAESA